MDLCVRLRVGRGSSYSFGGFHSKQQAHYFPSPIETTQAKRKRRMQSNGITCSETSSL